MARLGILFLIMTLCLSLSLACHHAWASEQKVPDDIKSLMDRSGGTAEYPDADVLTLTEDVSVEFKENGDTTTTSHSLVKILTENGKKNYSTLSFSYHRRYQEIEIPLARVIFPDGTFHVIDASAIKDTTSPETQEMNIFEENFRQKTVTIPNLAVGCTIEYTNVTKAKALLKNNYSDEFYFQEGQPVLHKKVTVRGPKSMPLRTVVKNGTLAFSESKEGALAVYTWEGRNMPQIISESGMVSLGDVAVKVLVSTFKSWKELSAYGESLNEGKVDMSPALRETVKKLTAGLATDEEKILAIFRFISQKIRYMGSSMDVGAFIEPHQATYTFDKQYGVCRDKSILMMAMLKEIGVTSFDTLINVNVATVTEVPTIYFQHAICAVALKNGSIIYMDPTLELSSSFGETYVGDKHVLLLSREGNDLVLAPPVPAEKSLGTISARTELKEDGSLTGTVQVKGKGYYDLVLRSVNNSYPAVQFSRFLSRLGTRFHPKAVISDVQSGNPVDLAAPYSFSFKLNARDYGAPAGDFMLLSIPLSNSPFDLVTANIFRDYTTLKERKYPMRVFSTCGTEQYSSLIIPASYRIVSIPPSMKFRQGPVSVTIETKLEGSTITCHSDCRIEKTVLSPKEYQDLRKAALELKAFTRKMVILEKKR
ncbi:MAG: DUF3857 and transglutaminase domain-containing protein [Candidatus Eremiobacteraeota bacterium]|nr:DUF3857 and transglutaminase domain-containing protein [Candidatus Eremiobacteraeota bacterium]